MGVRGRAHAGHDAFIGLGMAAQGAHQYRFKLEVFLLKIPTQLLTLAQAERAELVIVGGTQ